MNYFLPSRSSLSCLIEPPEFIWLLKLVCHIEQKIPKENIFCNWPGIQHFEGRLFCSAWKRNSDWKFEWAIRDSSVHWFHQSLRKSERGFLKTIQANFRSVLCTISQVFFGTKLPVCQEKQINFNIYERFSEAAVAEECPDPRVKYLILAQDKWSRKPAFSSGKIPTKHCWTGGKTQAWLKLMHYLCDLCPKIFSEFRCCLSIVDIFQQSAEEWLSVRCWQHWNWHIQHQKC